jgi:hypothetical protein
MTSGRLVPDDVVVAMVPERIATSSRFLLDGFPRTLPQARALTHVLKLAGRELTVAVFVDLWTRRAARQPRLRQPRRSRRPNHGRPLRTDGRARHGRDLARLAHRPRTRQPHVPLARAHRRTTRAPQPHEQHSATISSVAVSKSVIARPRRPRRPSPSTSRLSVSSGGPSARARGGLSAPRLLLIDERSGLRRPARCLAHSCLGLATSARTRESGSELCERGARSRVGRHGWCGGLLGIETRAGSIVCLTVWAARPCGWTGSSASCAWSSGSRAASATPSRPALPRAGSGRGRRRGRPRCCLSHKGAPPAVALLRRGGCSDSSKAAPLPCWRLRRSHRRAQGALSTPV